MRSLVELAMAARDKERDEGERRCPCGRVLKTYCGVRYDRCWKCRGKTGWPMKELRRKKNGGQS